MSSLVQQFREVLEALKVCDSPPALIGGLAVAAHSVIRATRDIDFLVAIEDADRLHAALLGIGYQSVYRSADAANYVRGTERFDVIYAARPATRRFLREAEARATPVGQVAVVSVEGLIALKHQTQVSSSARAADVGVSVEQPLVGGNVAPRAALGPDSPGDLSDFFELMELVELLCPEWPPRPLDIGHDYRL